MGIAQNWEGHNQILYDSQEGKRDKKQDEKYRPFPIKARDMTRP